MAPMFPSDFQGSFGDSEGMPEVDPDYESRRLVGYGVVRLRADNPGPLTLSGTNTWIVGERPAYVIDPGPALPRHLECMLDAIDARGGLGGIVLTHDHHDHCEAVEALREKRPAPVAAARGWADVMLRDGTSFGPLLAIPTPGHAPDHFALATDRACFTGDAVLGEGSVFVDAYPGSLAGYLNGLARLATLDVDVLCPGHGPPIWNPEDKIEQYIAHRYDREHKVLLALAAGRRSITGLLDAAWSDVPSQLRPAATITLAAHLDKLEEEGVLPGGVERPAL